MVMNVRLPVMLSTTIFWLALACPTVTLAAGVTVIDASRQELDSAKSPYDEGVKAMNEKQYKVAVEKFRQSYDIVASPNSRLMLGRALVKVNRPLEAYKEFEGTVALATELAVRQPKYKKTADAAKKELDDVRVELAFITVIPGTEVSIDGRKLSDTDWNKPIPVNPGKLTVEIMATDGRVRKKRMRMEPGVNRVLTADLTPSSATVTRAEDAEPAKEQESPREEASSSSAPGSGLSRKTVGYAAAGVGAAGVVGFIGFQVVGNAIFGDPKEHCNGTQCSAAAVDNGSIKGRYQGFSYASLTLGVLGLGVGAYLIFTDQPNSSTESANATALQVGPGSVSLTRTF